MRKIWSQITALVLALNMCIGSLPLPILADSISGNAAAKETSAATTEAPETEQTTAPSAAVPETELPEIPSSEPETVETTEAAETTEATEETEAVETTEATEETEAVETTEATEETEAVETTEATEETVPEESEDQDVQEALDTFVQQTVIEEGADYTVLVLESSSLMTGLEAGRNQAVIQLCSALLGAEGKHYLAVIDMNTTSSIACTFTDQADVLEKAVNGLKNEGGVHMEEALRKVNTLLNGLDTAGISVGKKNVIFCGSGTTDADTEMKSRIDGKIGVYAVGMFANLQESDMTAAESVLSNLAVENGFFAVRNGEKTESVFAELIACLVPEDKPEDALPKTEEVPAEPSENAQEEPSENTDPTEEENQDVMDALEAFKKQGNPKEPCNYTVLILDSSKDAETSMDAQKMEMEKMIHDLLTADSGHQIAVLAMNSGAHFVSAFTNDETSLKEVISKLEAKEDANIELALRKAKLLLDGLGEVPAFNKNVVLSSSGLPRAGVSAEEGAFIKEDHELYGQCNAVLAEAQKIREAGIMVYTVSDFRELSEQDRNFGYALMEQCATRYFNFTSETFDEFARMLLISSLGDGPYCRREVKDELAEFPNMVSAFRVQSAPDKEKHYKLSRYTILVLDDSGSMYGLPGTQQKIAATKFCQALLENSNSNPSIKNEIAIYRLKAGAKPALLDFTQDIQQAIDAIQSFSIPYIAATDYSSALAEAEKKMQSITLENCSGDQLVKNIVFCTDGLPTNGDSQTTGRYNSTDHNICYKYANFAVEQTDRIKTRDTTIYTLGFFHSLGNSEKNFCRELLMDMASTGKYEEVKDPNDLQFAFDGILEDILKPTPFKFKFQGQLVKNNDITDVCYYTDAYFCKDSRVYNESLATMSLCMELSAWKNATPWPLDPGVYEDLSSPRAPWCNAYDLLQQLGFKNFAVNKMWKGRPTRNSIGVIAASKEIIADLKTQERVPLIVVAIRGGGYEQEWAGNFNIGESGEHAGFRLAKEEVQTFVNSYIEQNNIRGRVKLWIVGYSRAGGTANLVGGDYNKRPSILTKQVSLAPSDMYVYTFEAPQGVLTTDAAGDHSNIHNNVNPYDLVTKVAPRSWNFQRYNGNDGDVTCPIAGIDDDFYTRQRAMLEFYNRYAGSKGYKMPIYYTALKHKKGFLFDPFGRRSEYTYPVKISTCDFLNRFVDSLAVDVIGSRKNYVQNMQKTMVDAMELIMSGDAIHMNSLLNDRLTEQIRKTSIKDILFSSYDESRSVVYNLFKEVTDKCGLSAEDAEKAAKMLTNVAMIAIKESYSDGENDYNFAIRNSLGAAYLMIAKSGFQPHYPEFVLSWMKSEDPNYGGSGSHETVGNYRIIHINCPVNVKVIEKDSGRLVGEIVNDQDKEIPGNCVPTYVNFAGEKIINLPADKNYDIILTATGNGTVNYTVEEFDFSTSDETRITGYFDVQIKKGDVLNGFVPAISRGAIPNGSSANYTLTDAGHQALSPDFDLRGQKAMNAVYDVKLSRNNKCGMISGAGSFNMGSFAELDAVAAPRGEFLGWFENGKLLSKEQNYRFAVTKDSNIEARFKEVPVYHLTFEVVGDGTIQNIPLDLFAGSEVQLQANAGRAGFIKWSVPTGTIENAENSAAVFTMPEKDVTVTAHFASEHPSVPVELEKPDDTGTLKPGAEVEFDGRKAVVEESGEICAPRKDCKIMVSYTYHRTSENIHEAYPTGMHVWYLTEEDENGDGKTDKLLAHRVTELDDFLLYKGTSIRINHKSGDGIRFFTAMPAAGKNALMNGKLLNGKLKGFTLKEMGTLYKWARTGTELTTANGAVSYVYGGSVGNNFRIFSEQGKDVWITGMLTQLPGDAKTLSSNIVSRPYMVLERNGEKITIYGGAVQRSIYYVAMQNRDYWKAGTDYDNYVENLIKIVESAKK